MSQQRHIINKQILEIHLPEEEDVHTMQADISQLYREKLVPIINELCDRYSAGGKQVKIEKLNIDLGDVELEDIETVFAQKFAEAIADQEAQIISVPGDPAKTKEAVSQQTPLHALSYYLMTGSLPWWAASGTKAYLNQLLDAQLDAPNPNFKSLLIQVGQKKSYRDRFIQTFSQAQVIRSLSLLSTISLDHLPKIQQALTHSITRKPERFNPGLTPKNIASAFWSAVFSHISSAPNHTGLVNHAIQQTLQALGADFAPLLNDFRDTLSSPEIHQWVEAQTSTQAADRTAIYQQSAKIRQQHPDNPLLQAFCTQISHLLSHPLFPQIDSRQLQEFSRLLRELAAAQKRAGNPDAATLKVVTETNLQPLAKHLHQLEARLKQMQPAPPSNVMEKLRTPFDDTDSISIQNAGLVLFWPFLQRFFENLELLNGKAFTSESARNKAACVLQYIADDAEESFFEGQFILNKVLCGIKLEEPVSIEPLSIDEKEIAEGLMESVISRGPYWKNLSLAGFRTSYLQREALLRSRDGHWLLQVKKETYDITLEKLPWGFNTIKLPWMNEILIVEWI